MAFFPRLAAPILLMCALSEGFLPTSRRPLSSLAKGLGRRRVEQQLVQQQLQQQQQQQQQQLQSARPRSWVVLSAVEENDVAEAEEEVKSEEAVVEEESASEEVGDGAVEGDAEEEEEEEEEEEPAEDPELVALKEELASLEKSVIETKKSLSAEKEKVVEAGKTGYLRLAANVENYKRRTKESKKDSEGIAMLAVTKAFFGKKTDTESSVMELFRDGLETLPVAEGAENEAKLHESYQALYRDMVDKFTKFGLQEYHAVVGERYDAAVHEKAGELQLELPGSADDPAPNTVTEEVSSGLKMKVGVVRRAKVVVAIAAPEPEKEEEPEEEVKEEEEPEEEAAATEDEAAGEEASQEAQEAPAAPKEEMPY